MSFDALAWAARASGLRPAEKLVLLGLAECADRHTYEAHPSIAALVEFGGLNRKTVIAALDTLGTKGLIAETGECVGKTKQVKVYRLSLETVPKTEPSPKRNSSTFSVKQSQKRDTDTVRNNNTPISSNEDIPPAEKSIKVKPEHLLEAWNLMAGRVGLSKAKSFDQMRRRKTLTLIKTRSTDDITEAIAAVERSPFCRGENDRGWKADFDFLLQPKSFNRLIEGFYG